MKLFAPSGFNTGFPLTPALSRRERENCFPSLGKADSGSAGIVPACGIAQRSPAGCRCSRFVNSFDLQEWTHIGAVNCGRAALPRRRAETQLGPAKFMEKAGVSGTRLFILTTMLLGSAIYSRAAETDAIAPVTARDFYNAGTQMLGAKKFAVAEQMFDAALSAQDGRVQPPALYNLGHTRFADGAERLKQGPDAQKVAAQGDAALAAGGNAIRSMEAALSDTNLNKLVTAYREGRGARRRVRDAEKAVQAAMQVFGYTLRQWERAVDDFNSAAELNPADTNAAHNAEIVERAIARLVDSLQAMQLMGGRLGDQKQQLDRLGAKLKGRIPAPDAPPGGYGEDEDEDVQPESLAGRKENAPREGGEEQQIAISPDLAKQMLDGLSPGGTRLLPLSDQPTGPPKERTGRNW